MCVKRRWSWHRVCGVCGSLLLLPAEEKSDPGRCSLLWINILQVVYFEEMTSRQNQKRGGRERERERKGTGRSREFILTSFDSPSHKEQRNTPRKGSPHWHGEGTPLDKSHYSPLASTAHTPSPKGRHSCDILWTKGCLFLGASWETPKDTTGNRPSLPRFTDWEAEKQLRGEVSMPFACLSWAVLSSCPWGSLESIPEPQAENKNTGELTGVCQGFQAPSGPSLGTVLPASMPAGTGADRLTPRPGGRLTELPEMPGSHIYMWPSRMGGWHLQGWELMKQSSSSSWQENRGMRERQRLWPQPCFRWGIKINTQLMIIREITTMHYRVSEKAELSDILEL